MSNLKILGTGNYLPELVVTNQMMSEIVETNDEWITSRTGISERRLSNGEPTWHMASEAARKAVDAAGVDPMDIDIIIVTTVTPDYYTPSTACVVQAELDADNAICYDVNAACSGFVYAIDQADLYLQKPDVHHVLVISTESLSKLTDFSDRSTCVLFGDGASAVLCGKAQEGEASQVHATHLGSEGKKANVLVARALAVGHPFVDPKKIWDDRYGNNPDHFINMEGQEVYKFAVRVMTDSIQKVLGKAGLMIEDLRYIIPHQANSRIVDAATRRLKSRKDQMIYRMSEFGNTSSASIPLCLDELIRDGRLARGDKIALCGFGGGLTYGAAPADVLNTVENDMSIQSICDLLGIRFPLIQGGMAWVSDAQLAAAVSNGGGLGLIAAGSMPAGQLRTEIARARKLTDRPFGVNIMLMSPYAESIADLVRDEQVSVVTTGAGSPGKYIEGWKAAGIKVVPVIASVAHARRMESLGADAVIAEGTEAGGHIGESTTMAIVPQVVDAISLPVIAAGGIADGRGVAAAFMLGASGVQIGTRFLASDECPVHDNYKKMVVKARDIDTTVTGRSGGHPIRTLKNKLARRLIDLEKSGATFEEIEEIAIGSLRRAVQDGNMEEGSFMAGQSAGLIRDIRSAADIISEIFVQAQDLLGDRLPVVIPGLDLAAVHSGGAK